MLWRDFFFLARLCNSMNAVKSASIVAPQTQTKFSKIMVGLIVFVSLKISLYKLDAKLSNFKHLNWLFSGNKSAISLLRYYYGRIFFNYHILKINKHNWYEFLIFFYFIRNAVNSCAPLRAGMQLIVAHSILSA